MSPWRRLYSLLLVPLIASALPQDATAQAATVRCESQGKAYQHCRAVTAGEARLITNLSSTRCVQGRNWDVDGRGVWVNQGCRGVFQVGRGVGRPPAEQGGVRKLSCASPEYQRHTCRVATRGQEVRLVRRLSNSACVEGRSWGWDRRGIWVDRGCAGEFEVGAPGTLSPGVGPGGGRLVRCESLDGRYSLCGVDLKGEVRLVQVLSSRPCSEGRSWGVEGGRGIWVDQGCRAEFELLPRQGGSTLGALGVLVGIGVIAALLGGGDDQPDAAAPAAVAPTGLAGRYSAFDETIGAGWQLTLEPDGTLAGMVGDRTVRGTWRDGELEVDGHRFSVEPGEDGFRAVPTGGGPPVRFWRLP